jgi:hypothetical protein
MLTVEEAEEGKRAAVVHDLVSERKVRSEHHRLQADLRARQ